MNVSVRVCVSEWLWLHWNTLCFSLIILVRRSNGHWERKFTFLPLLHSDTYKHIYLPCLLPVSYSPVGCERFRVYRVVSGTHTGYVMSASEEMSLHFCLYNRFFLAGIRWNRRVSLCHFFCFARQKSAEIWDAAQRYLICMEISNGQLFPIRHIDMCGAIEWRGYLY